MSRVIGTKKGQPSLLAERISSSTSPTVNPRMNKLNLTAASGSMTILRHQVHECSCRCDISERSEGAGSLVARVAFIIKIDFVVMQTNR
jgi:hypothetical protein